MLILILIKYHIKNTETCDYHYQFNRLKEVYFQSYLINTLSSTINLVMLYVFYYNDNTN